MRSSARMLILRERTGVAIHGRGMTLGRRHASFRTGGDTSSPPVRRDRPDVPELCQPSQYGELRQIVPCPESIGIALAAVSGESIG